MNDARPGGVGRAMLVACVAAPEARGEKQPCSLVYTGCLSTVLESEFPYSGPFLVWTPVSPSVQGPEEVVGIIELCGLPQSFPFLSEPL